MRNNRDLPSIQQAFSNLFRDLPTGNRIRALTAVYYWSQVVGPAAAAATEAENVKNGILFVRTKSSVWSHELNLHKSHLLNELNNRLGGHFIQEIVFRAKGIKSEQSENVETEPTEEELANLYLTPEERNQLDREMVKLNLPAESELVEKMRNGIERQIKLKAWRLANGWRICPECGVLFRLGDRCEFCRFLSQRLTSHQNRPHP
ncbi:MAG: DUF721 domain-containing protein [Armatimonadetes bacterium]|nr:DUF721 domain-containing protein [Armatimonadota bacterium]